MKLYAHHVTAICPVPGDDEQDTVIALTRNDEATFERTGGETGGVFAYVLEEQPDGMTQQQMADLLARSFNCHEGLVRAASGYLRHLRDLNQGSGNQWGDEIAEVAALILEAKGLPAPKARTWGSGWPSEWAKAALAEGWGLFDSDGLPSLQAVDMAEVFRNDVAAWKHVWRMAHKYRGTDAHGAALNIIEKYNPTEYARIKQAVQEL